MIKLIAKIYATFFGVGYFPIAPGTAASFIIVILYKLFLYLHSHFSGVAQLAERVAVNH